MSVLLSQQHQDLGWSPSRCSNHPASARTIPSQKEPGHPQTREVGPWATAQGAAQNLRREPTRSSKRKPSSPTLLSRARGDSSEPWRQEPVQTAEAAICIFISLIRTLTLKSIGRRRRPRGEFNKENGSEERLGKRETGLQVRWAAGG